MTYSDVVLIIYVVSAAVMFCFLNKEINNVKKELEDIKKKKNLEKEYESNEKASENFHDTLEIIKRDLSKYDIFGEKITIKIKARVCETKENEKITYAVDDPVVIMDVKLPEDSSFQAKEEKAF